MRSVLPEAVTMVTTQLRRRGIDDQRVLDAMARVPRRLFVPEPVRHRAWNDEALPLGEGQTISQPYVVALMTQMLDVQPGDRVLEIGTGSGYQAAVLAALGAQVFSVERHEGLARQAQSALRAAEAPDVMIRIADGTLGWPEHAPYDRIIVTASGPALPQPLLQQTRDGGRIVAPLGDEHDQRLVLFTRDGDTWTRTEGIPVRFVPLIGAHGWPAPA